MTIEFVARFILALEALACLWLGRSAWQEAENARAATRKPRKPKPKPEPPQSTKAPEPPPEEPEKPQSTAEFMKARLRDIRRGDRGF